MRENRWDPAGLSPSIAFSHPDGVLSLLPSTMGASWARLGCVFSRRRYCWDAGRNRYTEWRTRLRAIIVVLNGDD